MGNARHSVRRKLGVVFIIVPMGMILLGQTILKSRLDGVPFLIYWLVCFAFTFAAIFVALLDLRSIRRQIREETREVFERSLEQIQREGEAKQSPDDCSSQRKRLG